MPFVNVLDMPEPGQGPLEPTVRPRAWMVRQGSHTYYLSDAEFVRSSYDHGEFMPLYGGGDFDRLHAALSRIADGPSVDAVVVAKVALGRLGVGALLGLVGPNG